MSVQGRWSRAAVEHVDSRCSGDQLDPSMRITLNFHPDRVVGGVHILQSMSRTGSYLSQFETGTSNGGLTAHPGGNRWRWEQSMFGGAYDDAPAAERPKYGALDHRRRPLGGAPRFGSAHLRLRKHMLGRATFSFPDSAMAPVHFATARRFALWPLALAHDEALGRDPDDVECDPLDGYVEAQVHGAVVLAADVEALVMDPCFRGTEIEEAAHRLGPSLEWHEGRVLAVEELQRHVAYRGSRPVQAGIEVARDGSIDALVIGEAVLGGGYERQTLKQLWHLTAQWGSPRTSADTSPQHRHR